MKAMVLPDLTQTTAFQLTELPGRAPGPGEVLIRNNAASINVVDTKIRDGGREIAPADPIVLGCDVAGVIEKVGQGVTHLSVGDDVYGCVGGVGANDGSYATEMIADARLVARKPASLDFREAAALPLVTITAWEALVSRAQAKPGDRVLVHGGAGGVGHIGIQIAKALGAVVHTTVSSPEKAKIATDLGADETINYRDESVEAYLARLTGGEGYDVVFDTIGGDNIAPSLEAISVNGQVVTIVSLDCAPDLSALHIKDASLHVVFMLVPLLRGTNREHHGDILRRAAAMVDTGLLRPLLDATAFSLEQVGAAHAHLLSGKTVGKVVLDIA